MELGCRELRRRLGGLFTPGYVAAVSAVRLWRTTLTGRQTERARAALARLTEAAVAAYRAGDESTAAGRLRALGLDEAQARGAVGLFLLTGTETLVSFVPRLVALRVTSPTPVMLRSAARAGRIGGVRVAAGERVVIATLLCARAYGPFAPERDAAETAGLRRLWFGAGPHFCLGMPLAMAEVRAVVGALRGFPELSTAGRRPARGVLVPSYARLPVRARAGGVPRDGERLRKPDRRRR
ncbi:hypothetical protein [Streptomyces goshikiensis]|uniref:hypothetical protein n=1 Tax=Streptomyces goshikiensis TaxID=1942 RepID=UPI00333381B7